MIAPIGGPISGEMSPDASRKVHSNARDLSKPAERYARDAIPQDGAVTIAAENWQLEAGRAPDGLSGAFVVIAVSDNGQGMRPDVLSRVFDPFFTTKAVGKGTGQGLAMAHATVVEHGGSIHFETEVGRGTTFVIRLPLTA